MQNPAGVKPPGTWYSPDYTQNIQKPPTSLTAVLPSVSPSQIPSLQPLDLNNETVQNVIKEFFSRSPIENQAGLTELFKSKSSESDAFWLQLPLTRKLHIIPGIPIDGKQNLYLFEAWVQFHALDPHHKKRKRDVGRGVKSQDIIEFMNKHSPDPTRHPVDTRRFVVLLMRKVGPENIEDFKRLTKEMMVIEGNRMWLRRNHV